MLGVIVHSNKICIYMSVTNQKIVERNWHSDQKSEEQDIGSWTVEESSLVEDCLKIVLASKLNEGLGYSLTGRCEYCEAFRFLWIYKIGIYT